MKILWTAALGALALFSADARAFEAIDCSATAFEFADPAYNVDCERSKDSVRAGEASGGTTTDVMSITNSARTIFFTMVDQRINAPHIYLEHRKLRENFRAMFTEEGVEDWKAVDDKGDYDVAEFSRKISGQDSHCITVQRYTNAMYTGYKRHVIGMGCTVGDLEEVYQILQKMHSASD
jgi:hypothetical protein